MTKTAETGATDEMLVAAMRAFEPMSSVLRYREKDKWHACDMMAMREAIKAVLALRAVNRDSMFADVEGALRAFVDRLEKYGSWDDGCFYYNGRSASELQKPFNDARKILDSIKAST